MNVLFGIDLSSNKLNRVYNDNSTNPLITIFPKDKDIISLKGNTIRDSKVRTYFDVHNISNSTSSKVLEREVDYSTKTGAVYINFCYYENEVYTLYQEDVNGEIHSAVNVYDNSFNLSRSIDISLIDYILDFGIIEMQVFGDYLYINNYSNYALIGKIVNLKVEPILEDRDFELTIDHDTNTTNLYHFFKRHTNEFYILNTDTGDLTVHKLHINSNYKITCALSDNDNIFLVLGSTSSVEGVNKSYYIKKSDLFNTVYLTN